MSTCNHEALTDSLRSFPAAFTAYLADVSDACATWQPAPEAMSGADGAPASSPPWSILQIVCHLIDEETDDFPIRLRLTLDDPAQPWPVIDPERTARERSYDLTLADALKQFTVARAESLKMLHAVDSPDFSRAHTHPKLGALAAGDVLAAWAAHDHFHLRQIIKRRIQWLEAQAGPFSIAYADGSL